MNKTIYFDHAATTKLNEKVLEKMLPFFILEYGNPSSIYSLGRNSKRAIEDARAKVAKAINAKPNEIYFTGSGSESDNLAIKGIARRLKEKGNHIITSKIEHHAILNSCKSLEKEGFQVTYLNVDNEGLINLAELENAINETTILISIMAANNEIGTIEPIKEIGKIAKKHNIYFHTDCVQAIGNILIDVKQMNIDSLSMSAHKFYGPKGVGALYVKETVPFLKIQDGGHQEMDKRAGTENVAGIVGLGEAIEIAYKDFEKNNKKLLELRNYFISELNKYISDIKLNGHKDYRLPGNVNVAFKNVIGGDLLFKLDEIGICVSSGSACNSKSNQPSHVLLAIGLEPEYLQGSLRTTFGKENTKAEIDYLIQNLKRIVEECRK